MMELRQTDAFQKWETSLRDPLLRAAIAARLYRLANGLPGDTSPVGEGINELRIHLGSGYRIYYQQRGGTIVVLLCGGDKWSQRRDIETAKRLAREWKD
ncbi:type II toxin-antitoxin system RelE/ParE family toxin [Pseudoduganella namucuonensis]|uniref:type II toxin-antitoxin system RelE/ParE family toxin n=1 Tax=Pseudoduganella namucuonensis TaxID=1035707 RepID=UPI000B8852B0|nr:type II toxin-antitoxin system RelE/ParE family toxin [Pseudoduganella namucuonensis]